MKTVRNEKKHRADNKIKNDCAVRGSPPVECEEVRREKVAQSNTNPQHTYPNVDPKSFFVHGIIPMGFISLIQQPNKAAGQFES
jgi:hypothetical protein